MGIPGTNWYLGSVLGCFKEKDTKQCSNSARDRGFAMLRGPRQSVQNRASSPRWQVHADKTVHNGTMERMSLKFIKQTTDMRTKSPDFST
ncbi:rCG36815 [Rattus norvegicus]|uniref:RCG36815 n=1 Tax=Rattus norvegicus TaxID=10116 RepID=A6HUJ8_RAT|nr:rCG36815 [Rattus norvegicus]